MLSPQKNGRTPWNLQAVSIDRVELYMDNNQRVIYMIGWQHESTSYEHPNSESHESITVNSIRYYRWCWASASSVQLQYALSTTHQPLAGHNIRNQCMYGSHWRTPNLPMLTRNPHFCQTDVRVRRNQCLNSNLSYHWFSNHLAILAPHIGFRLFLIPSPLVQYQSNSGKPQPSATHRWGSSSFAQRPAAKATKLSGDESAESSGKQARSKYTEVHRQ